MIREVQLENYLPEFMQDYNEPNSALKAENPEFNIIWKATDKVLHNRFISTADEYGISRFEKMLGIWPAAGDTLESRRSMVQNKWFNNVPSTMKALIQKIVILCSDADFTIDNNFESGYILKINTNLDKFGKVRELEQILNSMIPCNIEIESDNSIIANVPLCENYIAGATTSMQMIEINNLSKGDD